jgi:hypothetical protein
MSAEDDGQAQANAAADAAAPIEGALARFRFHGPLNQLLTPARRGLEFEHRCARAASLKNAIESLGVPHTEVGRVLVNGMPAALSRPVAAGDGVEVFPPSAADEAAIAAVVRPLRFVADAHLGGLARLLRMLGFDTVFRNDLHDQEIRTLAAGDGRVVLSRDRELLKCRGIAHGCFVRALKPEQQLREVVERLHLASEARPFSLCLHCNEPLRPVAREEVLDRLPDKAARYYQRFRTCPRCQRVFWEGSHWQRMRGMLEGLGLPANG